MLICTVLKRDMILWDARPDQQAALAASYTIFPLEYSLDFPCNALSFAISPAKNTFELFIVGTFRTALHEFLLQHIRFKTTTWPAVEPHKQPQQSTIGRKWPKLPACAIQWQLPCEINRYIQKHSQLRTSTSSQSLQHINTALQHLLSIKWPHNCSQCHKLEACAGWVAAGQVCTIFKLNNVSVFMCPFTKQATDIVCWLPFFCI